MIHLDERIYDVDLSAAVYLLPYALVEACGLCIILMEPHMVWHAEFLHPFFQV